MYYYRLSSGITFRSSNKLTLNLESPETIESTRNDCVQISKDGKDFYQIENCCIYYQHLVATWEE